MIDQITNNPYRVLGVYATSSTAETVANQGRIKAFLNVGRTCEFPLDLPALLPPVVRTADSVAHATAQLTLPQDRLKHAQFWFVKVPELLDNTALEYLTNGETRLATRIWERRNDVSAWQNRVVCALMLGNINEAFACAESLYNRYTTEFTNIILGNIVTVNTDNLAHTFIDSLLEELGTLVILKAIDTIGNEEWREYVVGKSVSSLIDSIEAAISTAKQHSRQEPNICLQTGTTLMNDTKPILEQLQQILPLTDIRYQLVVDKFGLELSQYGMEAYDKNDTYSATKAIVLLEYAQNIVVGQTAKDKCTARLDSINEIVKMLPPEDVRVEYDMINIELSKNSGDVLDIDSPIKLLKNTKEYLTRIKIALGDTHPYYLRISTFVANKAMSSIISLINKAQQEIDSPEEYESKTGYKKETIKNEFVAGLISGRDFTNRSMELYNEWVRYHNAQVERYHTVLKKVWKGIELIDKLDRESSDTYFTENRDAISSLIQQAGISISTPETRKNMAINVFIVELILLIAAFFVNFGSKSKPANYFENILGLQLGWIPLMPWCLILYQIVDKLRIWIKKKI